MTPDQFISKLEATKEALIVALPDIAQKLTGNAKALAEKNILERGFGEKYSDNQIPVWFFKGKELNAGGTRYLEEHGVQASTKKKRKKKGEGEPIDRFGNWQEFRAAQGRQINWVDLSYSGLMWSGLTPLKPEVANYKALCRLGATNEQVAKEVAFNYLNYGDFIRKGLGENDFELLEQVTIEDIFEIVERTLL